MEKEMNEFLAASLTLRNKYFYVPWSLLLASHGRRRNDIFCWLPDRTYYNPLAFVKLSEKTQMYRVARIEPVSL